MSKPLSRRRFTQSLAATGVAVFGFDAAARAWVATPGATQNKLDELPELAGALTSAEATLKEYADDYGHIIHRTPRAVLHPGSVEDIVKMVRYANRHHIRIAMSGNHHATYGQSQVEAGIVINARALNRILAVDAQSANVESGVLWTELLQATLPKHLAPPVLTEYQEITVGGTLSVGGIGVSSPLYGNQGDNVLDLDVVTGDGRLVTCSPRRNSDLFSAVLGGLGQCGIIVRARVKLAPAPTHVVSYLLHYDSLDAYLQDSARIAREVRYEHQQGGPGRQKDGSWKYSMEVAKLYTQPASPDLKTLEAGLQFSSKGEAEVSTYKDYLHRTSKRVAAGIRNPHPRIEVFVPASKTKDYVEHILTHEAFHFGGAEFPKFRIFAFNSRPFRQGVFQAPKVETQFFVVGLLRSTTPSDGVGVQAMVANNYEWVKRANAAGGKLYPISAAPMRPADWKVHFGKDWPQLAAAKRRYDPNRILTPGQGIFNDLTNDE